MPLKPEKEERKRIALTINTDMVAVVKKHRIQQRRTKKACADHIGKSQSTYNLIESGSSQILAGELEMLRKFLKIPRDELWPPDAPDDNERWAWVVNREIAEGRLRITVDVDMEELPKKQEGPKT